MMLLCLARRVSWGLLGVLLSLLAPVSALAGCPVGHRDVPWQSLAPGVWVWEPHHVAEVAPSNGGFVAPVTVWVDGRRALLLDPGPGHLHGVRVRQSVKCRFGADVVAVVNSHAHAENVLANSAFADVPAIHATAETAAAMTARCVQCLESLTARVGAAAMEGTHIVLPNRTLRGGDSLRFGPHRIEVLAVEQAHTEGDLVLWMPDQRILWIGGLAYLGRVPELAQGNLERWVSSLERLTALNPGVVVSTVVSGTQGRGGATEAMDQTRAYLGALRQTVWDAMDAGGSAPDLTALDVPTFRHWVGYDPRHGFNSQRAWRELEPDWMGRSPSPSLAPPPAPR